MRTNFVKTCTGLKPTFFDTFKICVKVALYGQLQLQLVVRLIHLGS